MTNESRARRKGQVSCVLAGLCLTGGPTTSYAAEPDRPPACIDLVVIATIAEYDYELPGGMIMSWPWTLTLDIEQVLYGDEPRSQIDVTAVMHAEFNSEIEHFMFVLNREGENYVVPDRHHDIETTIVEDDEGNFIILVDAPLDPDFVDGARWLPKDYGNYLKPVSYPFENVWWRSLSGEIESWNDTVRAGDPKWLRAEGGSFLAVRGLHLNDMPEFVAARNAPECAREVLMLR